MSCISLLAQSLKYQRQYFDYMIYIGKQHRLSTVTKTPKPLGPPKRAQLPHPSLTESEVHQNTLTIDNSSIFDSPGWIQRWTWNGFSYLTNHLLREWNRTCCVWRQIQVNEVSKSKLWFFENIFELTYVSSPIFVCCCAKLVVLVVILQS